MRVVTANHSTYPRAWSGPSGQRLRRAWADLETGRIDDDAYRAVARSYVTEIIEEQLRAGVDIVTDGLVTWYDLICRPASRLDGVCVNGLVRFFDTNTYVRRPEVRGEIGGSFGVAEEVAEVATLTHASVKAVLPGPYTLARHSLTDDFLRTAEAYGVALRRELESLEAASVPCVQIEEPSLLRFPGDAPLVRHLLEEAVPERREIVVSLVTYFGDATALVDELASMPVDVLGFDLVSAPPLVDLLAHDPPPKTLGLGLVDGRNTKLEDRTEVARTLERVLSALEAHGTAEVYLQPSCGLDFLPRDRAKRKLERMCEIRNEVVGVSS